MGKLKKSATATLPAKPVPVVKIPKKPVRLTPELSRIKKILVAKRRILSGDVSHMEDEALNKTGQEAASQDISNFAELGSDNFEQEFTIGLIENEEEALHEIEQALDRIKDGTYGSCETCNKRVSKERLKVVPFTRHCIECQRKEEISPD